MPNMYPKMRREMMSETGKTVMGRATESAHSKVYGGVRNQATVARAKAIEAGLSPAKAQKAKLNVNVGKNAGASSAAVSRDPIRTRMWTWMKNLRSGKGYTQE
jgi:hypothetical protein